MSTRFSPDGLYYWDGQHWVSTLSPDGRFRWDGSAWVPIGPGSAPAGAYPQHATQRVPTSWTKPLQYAVAGWYTVSAVYALTLPFWFGGMVNNVMIQSMQQQQSRHPYATPPPPELMSMMTSFMSGAVWISALIGLAICLVAIVGALNRWTWLYYAVLVLLGFGLLAIPSDIASIATGSTGLRSGITMPSWTYWTALVLAIPDAVLFIVMIYALARRGPWGMTRQLPPAGQ